MGAAGVLPAAACVLLALLPAGRAQSTPPAGCGKDLSSLYYNLCDLSAAWGIAVEAVASLGVVTSFVLTIVLVASLPFVQDPPKKSLVATQVFFMLGTFGLFCLTFDFIVGPNFSTCASRRFLFGVLFGLCFSCLLAHAVALNFLARRNRGPRGWVTLAVALLLALVEVIINAEWLTITVARREGGPADPCVLADADFVLALTYVMVLLVAAFGTAWPALCGRYTRWRKHGAFILATTGLSMAIWVAWMAMYLYGNQRAGEKPGWDDPTLAIALVANACAFILLYVIPEVTHVTRRGPEQAYEDDGYPTRGVGYETILKEQKSQSMFVENKAFSMDEPSFAKKPVSPYSGYNGQLLTSVYQPTEMALMHKSEGPYDMILPRATAASPAAGSASSTLRAEDAFAVQARHATAQRSGQLLLLKPGEPCYEPGSRADSGAGPPRSPPPRHHHLLHPPEELRQPRNGWWQRGGLGPLGERPPGRDPRGRGGRDPLLPPPRPGAAHQLLHERLRQLRLDPARGAAAAALRGRGRAGTGGRREARAGREHQNAAEDGDQAAREEGLSLTNPPRRAPGGFVGSGLGLFGVPRHWGVPTGHRCPVLLLPQALYIYIYI
ncbi:oxidoreductase-like domain-containing protein 1 isoform 3-T3 [Mergus octosetaceus]